jgi:hypothetical protein
METKDQVRAEGNAQHTGSAQPPKRAFRLLVCMDADSVHELSNRCHQLSISLCRGEIGFQSPVITGGLESGGYYELQERSAMTTEEYHNALEEWLDRSNAQ